MDPQVVAIKQTVYRTGADSELMKHLIDAARSGKEVTVVVELMARFDEEANINWAAQLEEVGAHVVYGVVGHKTHAKMSMVVRREETGLRALRATWAPATITRAPPRSTPTSACSPATRRSAPDVNDVFMQLTGLGKAGKLKHLWQSPFTLHTQLIEAIAREAEHARAGKTAGIIAKMNALLEPEIIYELYEASTRRREDRPDRARRLRVAARHRGAVREHPGALDHRPFPRAQPHLPLPLERRRCFCPAPTGWTATSSAASRSVSRCSIRS